MVNGYQINTNDTAMDFNVIYGFISESYWAKGIPQETLKRALDNSLCFGVFTDSGNQIGFARVITDSATYAYLSDVFILKEHRGIGLSKWVVKTILEHPDLQGLRRIGLATQDAHGLYSQFGFSVLSHPDRFMEIWDPDVYQRTV